MMYRKILVALDTTDSDQELLPHIIALAIQMQSELLFLHVADGWAARNFDQLNLAESEEMKADWKYLEDTTAKVRTESNLTVTFQLALGAPSAEILKVAEAENVSLIAMASHGHRLVGDIIHGSTIEAVRHRAHVPILAIPPKRKS